MKMTLREFIKKIRTGWGFAKPYEVIRIGEALDATIPQDILDKEVEVKYEKWTDGYGPDFHYHYRWYVNGVRLQLENGQLAPTEVDLMFGYQSLPHFRVYDDGFVVGFDW